MGFFCLAWGLAVASFLGHGSPLQAQEATNPGGLASHAQVVAQDINRMRAQYGIHPLAVHPLLTMAAQAHVADMAANANYSHYGTDGSTVEMRVSRTGYGSFDVSENWVSVNDPSGAIGWWMNSYIHRNNLLNPKWTHVGVGMQGDSRNGMTIFVAVFGRDSAEGGQLLAAAAVPDAAPAAVAAPAATQVPQGGMDYYVQPGDTLSGIAQRFGMGWDRIAGINGLAEHSVLQIGQSLRIPNPNDPLPGIGGPVTAAQSPASYIEYVVQSGDTLFGVAARYDLTWQELASLNGLGEFSVLELGRVLRIPSPAAKILGESAASAEKTAAPRVHSVAPGETIISIAAQYGIGWGELLELNGLNEASLIQVGQELRLP
jgi:LysM repeat protein